MTENNLLHALLAGLIASGAALWGWFGWLVWG